MIFIDFEWKRSLTIQWNLNNPSKSWNYNNPINGTFRQNLIKFLDLSSLHGCLATEVFVNSKLKKVKHFKHWEVLVCIPTWNFPKPTKNKWEHRTNTLPYKTFHCLEWIKCFPSKNSCQTQSYLQERISKFQRQRELEIFSSKINICDTYFLRSMNRSL